MLAAAAAQIEFVLSGGEAALQGADDAGGNARGMPIHPHHRAERLKPERMGQPLKEGIAPVMMNDGFRDNPAERRHTLSEPRRHPTAMQRKISTASSLGHLGSGADSRNNSRLLVA